MVAVVADFGLATKIPDPLYVDSICGHPSVGYLFVCVIDNSFACKQ